MTFSDIIFDPLVSETVLLGAAILSALILALAIWRGLAGWPWRAMAALVVFLALVNPSLQFQEREPLRDIVVVLTDETASQSISDRSAQTDAARETLLSRLGNLADLEIREISVGDSPNNGGTAAMASLSAALAEVPRDRLAGVFILSDGQINDMDSAPEIGAPIHLLMTGRPTDWDRRLVIHQAPAYAILGEPVTLTVSVEDQGLVPTPAPAADIAITVDDNDPIVIPAQSGSKFDLQVTLPHGGINVVHLALAAQPGELTDRNNDAIVQINGVRDRLSVLLVSGEPHPGGRTWRNLLKSDSAVDLVHFTILRPPEKQDSVPVSELSLIAFPTRELFLEKIDDFDLIIFDRYKRRGILPNAYLENIRAYVENGGAILMAAGPEYASANSLYHSVLGGIFPATPTGFVVEEPFAPVISEVGARHPVTAGLGGADPQWGRWLRFIETEPVSGNAVLEGPAGQALLVLDRVGEGRIALLASDQAWLWDRGFEGGGPQLELLRRLAHWMMKEPELEEEALSVQAEGQNMTITRRSLEGQSDLLQITRPDGQTDQIPMQETAPGRFVADYAGPMTGLYRITDGDLTSVAAIGPSAPREFEETIATAEKLAPILGPNGGVFMLSDEVPSIRTVAPGRRAHGRGWAAITPRDASRTVSVRIQALLPAWLALLLTTGLALAGWLREGRR